MPHTREHDAFGATDTQTQQSGYTPARDMRVNRSTGEKVDERLEAMKDTARDTVDRVKERADQGIDRAAEGVQKIAGTLHDRAEHYDGLRADANARVADTMDRTADYLREHDSEQLFGDVKSYVRKHPLQAVAGAIIGGLVLGKFFL